MPKEITYRVCQGDVVVLQTQDKKKAEECYKNLPAERLPSKRRYLEKVEFLKQDKFN